MRTFSTILAAGLLGAATLVPAPVPAADLGITLVQLRPSSVDLRVVCPVDPPQTVLVYEGEPTQFLGSTPISCAGGGTEQDVTVPLQRTLAAGAVVDLSATVSGDSGEINASFPGTVVVGEPSHASVPSAPRSLRARVCARSVTLSWTAPARDGGSAIDRYSSRRSGSRSVLAVTTRHRTFTGLVPRRAYGLRVAAHNQLGFSRSAALSVRTTAAGRPCRTIARRT
jgi:hypothetical protein